MREGKVFVVTRERTYRQKDLTEKYENLRKEIAGKDESLAKEGAEK